MCSLSSQSLRCAETTFLRCSSAVVTYCSIMQSDCGWRGVVRVLLVPRRPIPLAWAETRSSGPGHYAALSGPPSSRSLSLGHPPFACWLGMAYTFGHLAK
jgi:hypothetical protein